MSHVTIVNADNPERWRCEVGLEMTVEELRPAAIELGLQVKTDPDGMPYMVLTSPGLQEPPSIEEITRSVYPDEQDVIGVEESGRFRTLKPEGSAGAP